MYLRNKYQAIMDLLPLGLIQQIQRDLQQRDPRTIAELSRLDLFVWVERIMYYIRQDEELDGQGGRSYWSQKDRNQLINRILGELI